MEITTIAGIALGFALLIGSILIPGASLIDYADPLAALIVLGGVLAATLASCPLAALKNLAKAIGSAFRPKKTDLAGDVGMVLEVAGVARREGILALEETVLQMDEPFLRKGIMLIIDGSDPELVRRIMTREITLVRERHAQSQSLLLQMASYATAFGIIGTLISLLNRFGGAGEAEFVVRNAALSLVAAFYGVALATIVLTPLARKLQAMSDVECVRDELILEGILSIQDGENPRIIREKLNSFLPRTQTARAEPAPADKSVPAAGER